MMTHRKSLDGLRFFAFFGVFYFHYDAVTCPWGWVGVNLFFGFSGFLITRVLIEGETARHLDDLKQFYWRRTLRIFPLYYAALWLIGTSGPPGDLTSLLTYTYNIKLYFNPTINAKVGHFWTLCIEEQFYLIYPLVLLFTRPRFRSAMVVVLLMVSKAFQAYALTSMRMPWAKLLLPFCGEDLLWGCLAGMVELKTRPGRIEGTASFLVGILMVLIGWHLHEGRLPLPAFVQDLSSSSILGIGCSLVVFGLWRTKARWIVGPLSFGPLAYLGRISYGLYVFHLPVLYGNWIYFVPFGFVIRRPFGALVLTIALATFSWLVFEGPINRLKDLKDGPVRLWGSRVRESWRTWRARR